MGDASGINVTADQTAYQYTSTRSIFTFTVGGVVQMNVTFRAFDRVLCFRRALISPSLACYPDRSLPLFAAVHLHGCRGAVFGWQAAQCANLHRHLCRYVSLTSSSCRYVLNRFFQNGSLVTTARLHSGHTESFPRSPSPTSISRPPVPPTRRQRQSLARRLPLLTSPRQLMPT